MIESSTFKQFNLTFVNIVDILRDIEVKFINDLVAYDLLSKNRITRDIKKLLYHHTFYGLSEYLLTNRHHGKVIFVIKKTNPFFCLQLNNYFKTEDITKQLEHVLQRVGRLLPISIYSYDFDFNITELSVKYNEGVGEVREFIELIRSFQWSNDFIRSHFTFAKVRNFAKRNELTFLDEKYFNQIKTKQLLMT